MSWIGQQICSLWTQGRRKACFGTNPALPKCIFQGIRISILLGQWSLWSPLPPPSPPSPPSPLPRHPDLPCHEDDPQNAATCGAVPFTKVTLEWPAGSALGAKNRFIPCFVKNTLSGGTCSDGLHVYFHQAIRSSCVPAVGRGALRLAPARTAAPLLLLCTFLYPEAWAVADARE